MLDFPRTPAHSEAWTGIQYISGGAVTRGSWLPTDVGSAVSGAATARGMQLNVGGVRLIKVLYGYKVHVAAALTVQKHDLCKAVKHLRTREQDLPAYKVFALAQTPTSLIDGVCFSIDYHMGAF